MFNFYEVILDDGQQVYKTVQVGTSVRDVKKKCQGNGEVVRIQKVLDSYTMIDLSKVYEALTSAMDANSAKAIIKVLEAAWSPLHIEKYASFE